MSPFFSPNGEWLAYVRENNCVSLWRLTESGKVSQETEFVTRATLNTNVVFFGPHGKWLVAHMAHMKTSRDPTVRPVWRRQRQWNRVSGASAGRVPLLVPTCSAEKIVNSALMETWLHAPLVMAIYESTKSLKSIRRHSSVIEDDCISLFQFGPHWQWLLLATSDRKTSDTTVRVWSVGRDRDPKLHLTVHDLCTAHLFLTR